MKTITIKNKKENFSLSIRWDELNPLLNIPMVMDAPCHNRDQLEALYAMQRIILGAETAVANGFDSTLRFLDEELGCNQNSISRSIDLKGWVIRPISSRGRDPCAIRDDTWKRMQLPSTGKKPPPNHPAKDGPTKEKTMGTKNNFAVACYDTNSILELNTAIKGEPDEAAMAQWGLTQDEWREQISMALEWKLEDRRGS